MSHLPNDLSAPHRVVPTGRWTGFRLKHLHDYNAAATRLWCLLAVAGICASAHSGWLLFRLDLIAFAQVVLGIVFVGVTALFPVHIPRTKYSISVSDVFVFSLLALYGAPAAALAAGVEGLVGALRTSKRLTSRVSTPSVAAVAMLGCGMLFDAIRELLASHGVSLPAASLAALCAVALPYFAGTTLPLLAIMAAKSRQVMSLKDWAANYAWLGAIYLGSALIAGELVLNARQFGPAVIVVAALVAFVGVLLVNSSLRRHEAERSAQEASIALARHEATVNEQRFLAAFANASIGMAIVRPDGGIQQTNRALCELMERDDATLRTQRFVDLLHAGDAELFERRVEDLATSGSEAIWMELRCRAQHGEIWVSLHCGRFIDPIDERSGFILQLHDITSRRRAEGQLHYIAYHDTVTDLANRNCFSERLELAVDRSRLDASQRFAVMFLDLDRFKMVNDSLGHVAGNTVLREVAERLNREVGQHGLVARLGGDEFAVLLERPQDANEALSIAERLMRALNKPMMVNGTEVSPSASIGVTFSDMGYRTCDEVLRDADLAMYDSKAGGRQRVTQFESSMHERVAEKLKLEGDLRRAIGEGQLALVYQPLFDLKPYRLSGFEALARWEHPERGHISPAVFITLAEESGNIEALSAWVIKEAAKQLAEWRAQHAHMRDVGMHVNISSRDLANATLLPHVRSVLDEHQLPAQYLTLEITESMLMGDLSSALRTLHSLRELGVTFSIDDFGTGYSSLAYLSTLPIDSLKIDRSFVSGMDDQPQNVEIVRAVINLGRSLGKKVIAEGIETTDQLATLRDLGVHVGQGYLLSRPLRPDQMGALLVSDDRQLA